MTQTMDDREICLDRMRFVKNTTSSRLCYLAILLNVLFKDRENGLLRRRKELA